MTVPLAALLLSSVFLVSARVAEAAVTVEECAIVSPAPTEAPKPAEKVAEGVRADAVEELRKHLQLITGREIATVSQGDPAVTGKYVFHVGIPAPGDDQPLAPEEARWVVTPQAAYLYGEGIRGVQFAVYGFLEDQLGVRWIEPGDRGIAFQKQFPLALKEGKNNWAPELRLRKIRVRDRAMKQLPIINATGDLALFDGFRRTLEEQNQDAAEGMQWQQRMRMGGHDSPEYGHAFTKWWDKYHQSNPDYFALTKAGKREPAHDPRPAPGPKPTDSPFTARQRSFVKLCVSNPKVVEQVIQDWLPSRNRSRYLGVSENDMGGFCVCPECRALDVPQTGERDMQHLTDRYVHFTNAVAREAARHKPDVRVVMYAYNPTELPPRRERVEPNVTVALVPTTFNLGELQSLFTGWKNAGATELLVRPNFHWYYTTISLPMGYEKHWFDVAQLAIQNGAVGFDFDSIKRNWPTTGMANYVLAKAMVDPSKPFEYWEDHYLAAYGAAATEVKAYYHYWRTQVWNERLHPAMGTLLKRHDINFCRALLKQAGDYYQAADFDRTDAILQAAAGKTLDAPARAKLDQLILANRHARLVYDAVTTPAPAKLEHAAKLLEFRRAHEMDLSVTWIDIIAMELTNVDTGLPAVVQGSASGAE